MAGTTVTVGVDIGTSGTKGIAVTADGRVVASATAEYPLLTPRPGWSEQHPEDWWDATAKVLRSVTATPGLEIAAVGLSGQMHGSVFLDADDQVIRPALLWNDARTGAECAEIDRRLGRERVIEITGNPASAGMQAPKILWLRNHEPEHYARIGAVLLPKDFIRVRLTGGRMTDASDASGTLLVDLEARQWADEMLTGLEVPRAWLPEIVESAEVTGRITEDAARVTGLPSGTPVVAGGADNACAALGAGIATSGSGACSIGTSGTVFVHNDRPAHDPEGRLNAFCAAVPGGWHLMGVILSAGGCLRWLRDTLGAGHDFTALIDEGLTAPPGADGLFFLPYLAGERSPHMDPDARGAWIGLSLAHGRPHLIRAAIEGVGFAFGDCVGRMRTLGAAPRQLAVVGGGARHAGWRHMLEAQLDVPLQVLGGEEGPALGAALLAQVGAGMHRDVADACAACVATPVAAEPPDADLTRLYAGLQRRYGALYPALKAGGAFAA